MAEALSMCSLSSCTSTDIQSNSGNDLHQLQLERLMAAGELSWVSMWTEGYELFLTQFKAGEFISLIASLIRAIITLFCTRFAHGPFSDHGGERIGVSHTKKRQNVRRRPRVEVARKLPRCAKTRQAPSLTVRAHLPSPTN